MENTISGIFQEITSGIYWHYNVSDCHSQKMLSHIFSMYCKLHISVLYRNTIYCICGHFQIFSHVLWVQECKSNTLKPDATKSANNWIVIFPSVLQEMGTGIESGKTWAWCCKMLLLTACVNASPARITLTFLVSVLEYQTLLPNSNLKEHSWIGTWLLLLCNLLHKSAKYKLSIKVKDCRQRSQ